MEVRPSRGRGGSWKRGGRGGHDGDSSGGEHRGRGRGGHHRGRGKRDHYRGRGRGEGAHAAFHYRDQDGGDDNVEEDDDNRQEVFSRRKLGSNWDRYEESERKQPDDDTPTQRGADFHVLLESAGDSFTQFRFLEEKDWEMDSFAAGQMSAVFVDLPALAQTLQQVPLHQRLHLEAELVQVFTPVELPTMKPATKQETPKMSTFTPASATFQGLDPKQKVPASTSPVDDDEELDQLLSLQKPVLDVSGDQTDVVTEEESAGPEKACAEMKEVIEDKMEEVEDEVVTPPESASVKQEMTEEDLEDWLDSMIS
ncbi:cell death regulator Aven [Scophthalmus maximus]|uniref:cell death regulator Aven n=1 Tax=Scophthalmus maximus TaxID=52904 RepID=UPI001FA8BF23|nr:cell death regulator Aven [Scophthalmus maximus]